LDFLFRFFKRDLVKL